MRARPDGKPPPYHLIAVLTAASEDAALAALGSPECQAAVADLPNFAAAGVELSFGTVDSEL